LTGTPKQVITCVDGRGAVLLVAAVTLAMKAGPMYIVFSLRGMVTLMYRGIPDRR